MSLFWNFRFCVVDLWSTVGFCCCLCIPLCEVEVTGASIKHWKFFTVCPWRCLLALVFRQGHPSVLMILSTSAVEIPSSDYRMCSGPLALEDTPVAPSEPRSKLLYVLWVLLGQWLCDPVWDASAHSSHELLLPFLLSHEGSGEGSQDQDRLRRRGVPLF